MLKKHTFNVIVVGEGMGIGIGDGAAQAHTVAYSGAQVAAKL
jgi:hypothetical protein